MKKIALLIMFVAAAAFFSLSPLPKAQAVFLPFGGKISNSSVPGVVCPGEGPFSVIPSGISPASPYATLPSTLRYGVGVISPGFWILGLYTPILAPVCGTTSIPPAPVPAFSVFSFGTSK